MEHNPRATPSPLGAPLGAQDRDCKTTPSHSGTPYGWRDRRAPPIYWFSAGLPYTSQAGCCRLRIGMGLNSAHQRAGRSSGKRGSAYRAASRRPGRLARRRRAPAAHRRRRRRPLLFFALTASFAGELTAIAVDMEVLVLLFSLTTLFLCAVAFQAAKA